MFLIMESICTPLIKRKSELKFDFVVSFMKPVVGQPWILVIVCMAECVLIINHV